MNTTVYAFTPSAVAAGEYVPYINLSEGKQADTIIATVRSSGVNPTSGTIPLDREQVAAMVRDLSRWLEKTA